FVPARSSGASRRQRVGCRKDGGHRPKDLSPPHQQVPDPRLTRPRGSHVPPEALAPHTSAGHRELTPWFSSHGCVAPALLSPLWSSQNDEHRKDIPCTSVRSSHSMGR